MRRLYKETLLFKTKHASPFKDEKGRWLTIALFFEYRASSEENLALFCLKENDHVDDNGRSYISLKKRYMSYQHIPLYEHEFATTELGGWDHWERLQANKYLRENIEAWRREYEIALRCAAIKAIMKGAAEASPRGLIAAKWLAEKGYIDKRPGRVSKDEVERERKQQAAINETLAEDMARLGISVVNGGKID